MTVQVIYDTTIIILFKLLIKKNIGKFNGKQQQNAAFQITTENIFLSASSKCMRVYDWNEKKNNTK